MYANNGGSYFNSSEELLLGKRRPDILKTTDASKTVTLIESKSKTDSVPFSPGEMETRAREDPLFSIKKKELDFKSRRKSDYRLNTRRRANI